MLFGMFLGKLSLLLQQWYTSTMNMVCTWLTDRMDLQLHIYQLKTLIRIVKVSMFYYVQAVLFLEGNRFRARKK